MEKRKLGRTNFDTSLMGLGGEGLLKSPGKDKESYQLVNKALDLGINFFETSRSYGHSDEYYGNALRERRKDIFLTSRTRQRTKKGSLQDLEETLVKLKTDHLDLWQLEDADVGGGKAMEAIFAPGGAIEAFDEARQKGYTRFTGLGGHEDPDVIRQCLENFDFDTVYIPVNPAQASYVNFLDHIKQIVTEKNIGVIGTAIYVQGFTSKLTFYTSMEAFFRYAVSQPVATTVISCDTMEQLEQNIYFARSFKMMDWDEQDGFIEAITPYARTYFRSPH